MSRLASGNPRHFAQEPRRAIFTALGYLGASWIAWAGALLAVAQ